MVAGVSLLADFPDCGQPPVTDRQPWLGALYAVDLQHPGRERLISPVTLLSATSRRYPNHPTILVAPGSIMAPYTFSLREGAISVAGDNSLSSAALEDMVS